MKIEYMALHEIEKMMKERHVKAVCIGIGKIFHTYGKEIVDYIAYLADTKKVGEVLLYENRKFVIKSPEEIGEMTDLVVILTTTYYKEILQKFKNTNITYYIPYDILKLNIKGNKNHIEWKKCRIYEAAKSSITHLAEVYGLEKDRKNALLEYIDVQEKKNNLILPKLCFLATTRCTLKCNGCIGMIDKMRKQEDYPLINIKNDIRKILLAVDGIITAEISGGEPFLYEYFDELLEFMLQQDKIYTIVIPTNATILPSANRLRLLQNPKVLVHISDYGNLIQIAKLITVLEENNVHFNFLSDQYWIDPGNEKLKRNKSYEQLCIDYQLCNNGLLCKTIFDGRLYHCARAARYYWLMNNQEFLKKDSLNIYENDELCNNLENFWLSELCYACDACDLTSIDASKIDAGIQINTSLKHKSKFTICKRK